MKFIADLHIHSHHSLATSRELCPEYLDYWARLKGIRLVGTGDFTHPGWTKELKEKLEPAEEGLFRLKREYRKDVPVDSQEARFLLTAEISCIYKKEGRVRKVHNILFAPGFAEVEKIQSRLAAAGFNITSDGRPILGLDARDLLEMMLGCSEDIFFVPAHIWTPWFSVLGEKSGFDSVKDCYADLTGHIRAVEMGLSSDPPMNWMCSFLDAYTLTANSDAHSPDRLGRNANLFDAGLSYPSVVSALKTGKGFLGTISFFPQEGKYHYDGHRKCNVCLDPLESLRKGHLCPVCGKKVTAGVMSRVADLADRDDVDQKKERHDFHSLIPLRELLSEILQVGQASKKLDQQYLNLLRKCGPELGILLHADTEDIRPVAGDHLAEAIRRMRNREVIITEGYDGEYGRVRVFRDGEVKTVNAGGMLFGEAAGSYHTATTPRPLVSFDVGAYRLLKKQKAAVTTSPPQPPPNLFTPRQPLKDELDTGQQEAVNHLHGPALIMAGPGTGKTRVLTERIAGLILRQGIPPESILAVTFTNKAAGEMSSRVSNLIKSSGHPSEPAVMTFHAFGLSVLKKHYAPTGRSANFSIFGEEEREQALLRSGCVRSRLAATLRAISLFKQNLQAPQEIGDRETSRLYQSYESRLLSQDAFDLDDLLLKVVGIFSGDREILYEYRDRYRWMLVDEYQDVNLAQYRMIRLLMNAPGSNLFVIGDPNQAIYGFRGADSRYIDRFREDYPEAVVYRLRTSYRCPDGIIRASANIIRNGAQGERFLEGLAGGIKIRTAAHPTDRSEAEFIARTIEKMMGGVGFFSIDSDVTGGEQPEESISLSDFAILCRTGRQMPAIEKALRDHNIPYQRVGEEPFFRQEPIASVLELFRLAHQPANRFLQERVKEKKLIPDGNIPPLHRDLTGKSPREELALITERYFPKEKDRHGQDFRRLLDMADEYGDDPGKFITALILGTGIDAWSKNREAVSLMTLHASKGLEFPCVFIAGCNDGLLPYHLFGKEPDDEEERRLLYVGMTRAKKYLFLTYARKHFLAGGEMALGKSPFLEDIEKELLEQEDDRPRRQAEKDGGQLDLF
jgi:uncharacterized protein (TIGR00375 family)